MTEDMNPRYLHYCRVHGRTPQEQAEHDAVFYPGGKMCGFIVWMQERWREFYRVHGAKDWLGLPTQMAVQSTFDRWLSGLPIGHGVSK